jgi:FtsH-binding integral membrane protein
MYIPAFHPIEKHIYLIAWLLTFALMTYPMTIRANEMSTIALTEIMVICLSLILVATGVVLFFPKLVTPAWGLPLFLGLTGLIVAQLFSLFLNTKSLYTTYFAIVLFTIFISYDTKLALTASKTCIEGKADYIKYSMGLFLDIVNLFANLENR